MCNFKKTLRTNIYESDFYSAFAHPSFLIIVGFKLVVGVGGIFHALLQLKINQMNKIFLLKCPEYYTCEADMQYHQ